ncbi:hypothetical protein BOTBODRAFT_82967, partial [Botryobasidium botryosum FD-172 SS1]
LDTGTTITPVIISLDKTQLTLFSNKTTYPVYITIGNIPKEVWRKPLWQSQILLVYLPTMRLEHIKCKASCRRALMNLFHACMRRILSPLKATSTEGMLMASIGDGIVRHVHLIFAIFVGEGPWKAL